MKQKQLTKPIVAFLLTICMVLQMASGFTVFAAEDTVLSVTGLECEYTENPLGIDEPSPNLSWELSSTQRGVTQESYRIMVASSEENLNAGNYDAWDSGIVASD